jgi:Fic family protein
MRAGRYVKQSTGYLAFLPAPLPPNPPVVLNDELATLLEKAASALGQLDGVASILPDPDLFVAMYVLDEAVLSSQIEGTQSSLEEVLEHQVKPRAGEPSEDVHEIINYVRAMKTGLARLQVLPLSLRLLREIHGELMKGARGGNKEPGEFRRSQNWIGESGATLATASFIPPPPHEMTDALGNLEFFLHVDSVPLLLRCGLAHAQFETIHPFLDGNGRMGRLLITFLLCEQKALSKPLLYLSTYLKAHRSEYYDRLTAIRLKGDWEGWLKFFLTGIHEVSLAAAGRARDILALREEIRGRVAGSPTTTRLTDYIFKKPVFSVTMAAKALKVVFPTAQKSIDALVAAHVLSETTGKKRNRSYRFGPYLSLFASPKPGLDGAPTG